VVLVPQEIYTSPYLDLDEMRAGLPDDASSLAHAHSITKHRGRLERRGQLRVEVLQKADSVMGAFDLMVRWLGARWGEGASALDVPRLQRFHRHALPLLLAEGRLRMVRLSSDMRPVAVFYGLASGRPAWWGSYLIGYDREWAGRIHLGRIAFAAAIELATRDGAAEFDFLKGAEPVKYLWPVRERTSMDADVYSENAGAQLTRAARAAREAAAALAKSLKRRTA
jgi:CelD/BcsL family acetyltransferase involved in cellulose biosynthesis